MDKRVIKRFFKLKWKELSCHKNTFTLRDFLSGLLGIGVLALMIFMTGLLAWVMGYIAVSVAGQTEENIDIIGVGMGIMLMCVIISWVYWNLHTWIRNNWRQAKREIECEDIYKKREEE